MESRPPPPPTLAGQDKHSPSPLPETVAMIGRAGAFGKKASPSDGRDEMKDARAGSGAGRKSFPPEREGGIILAFFYVCENGMRYYLNKSASVERFLGGRDEANREAKQPLLQTEMGLASEQ